MYTLKDNNIFDIKKEFPLSSKKIAVMFSGGMESTMAGKLAIDRYGKEQCIFIYHGTSNSSSPEKNFLNIQNVECSADILGIDVEYYATDEQHWRNNREKCLEEMFTYFELNYNVGHFIYGFTKLLFDVECFSRMDNPSIKNIKKFLELNADQYKQLIDQFHTNHTDIYIHHVLCKIRDSFCPPPIYDLMTKYITDGSRKLLVPFRNIYKQHVLDLCMQMKLYHIMEQTRSCTEKTRQFSHCGKCFNCQQRHDAHILFGMEDPTLYENNDIIIRRKMVTDVVNV